MKLATIATTIKRIPRLAFVGIGFIVSLAVTFAMVPPESIRPVVVAPAMAAAALMLLFGPYFLGSCLIGIW